MMRDRTFILVSSVFLVIFCTVSTHDVIAQRAPVDSAVSRYGGFFHLNLNLHRGGFTRLPGVPNCCQEFTGGSGLGFTLGGMYQLPLSYSFFLDLRAGYSLLSGDLRETEETTVIINGEPVEGAFEHQLDAGLSALLIEPSLLWRLHRVLEYVEG